MTTTPNTGTPRFIDILAEKLLDADTGGFLAECTPAEAEAMGAFPEDALELDDAIDGAVESAAE
jgi:hypothetical protein